MHLPILDVAGVTASQLCCGCGACATATPGSIRMVDVESQGRRPLVIDSAAAGPALSFCPGHSLEHCLDGEEAGIIQDLVPEWGPVYGVWEGYAADETIRRAGSSGGAATALALHAVERGGMHGVLHTAARVDRPYLNETVLSTTRQELLERTGSRYAPASPAEGLGRIEAAPGPCVFIGKPCDVAAAVKVRHLRPAVDAKLGLSIAFFCAGTPSTRGTIELLRSVGVENPESVTSLRYRGNGWPGRWTVRWTGPEGETRESSLTYEESWGFLQRFRQWRCSICPDHTGEFGDVAVGDPWYRSLEPGEPGRSLIVARTRRGLDAVRAAAQDGYLTLEREDASLLPRSQPNLLAARGRLWGQMVALRLLGLPRPEYKGFPMFRAWLGLPLKGKLQSLVGTARRARRRGLSRPIRAAHDSDPAGRESTA